MAKKVDGELVLSNKEMDKILFNDLFLEKNDLAHKLEKARLLELQLRSKLLGNEIEKQNMQLEKSNALRAESLKARQSFLGTIAKKHDLPKGWGYDPDSGKIVIE